MTPVEVVGFADVPWESLGEHREYHLRIKTMLRGREGTLDNFRITYSEGTGGIQKGPRHRHTFDQIRMPFSGRTSIGSRRWLQPGEIGYFPEGVHYGPTVDEMDVGHTQITLQFGGASGLGFMSGAEIRNATKELEAVGTFEKGLFRRADGDPIRGRKVQDAFEAIWEHFYKRRIVYPAPRYADQIVMRPANFAWEPHPDAPGVLVKPLGDFTERHLTVYDAARRTGARRVARTARGHARGVRAERHRQRGRETGERAFRREGRRRRGRAARERGRRGSRRLRVADLRRRARSATGIGGRGVIARSLVAGVALSLALAATSAADAPLQTIRVATVPIDAGSEVYYAQKLGFFKNNGLDVEITGLSNGAAVTSAVIGGAADIGQSNAVSVAQAHERGIPVVIIAGANRYLVQADESGLVTAVDSPIHSAQDLNGKTVAISGIRGIQELGLRNWMDKNGGDSKTVKLLDMPFTAMTASIAQHRVDAALVTQPELQAALDTKQFRLVADVYAAIAKDFLLGGWIATTPFVQAHPDLAAAFAKAIYQTAKWANTHHAESAVILEEASKVHMTRSDHRIPFAEKTTTADLQPVIDICAKYGLLKAPFPAGEIVLQ